MAKATIVSLLPFPIREQKTVHPNNFYIDKAEPGNMSLLHISDGHYYMNIPGQDDEPPLKIPVDANTLADSLVKDHNQGLLGLSDTAKPGLFWVEGLLDKGDIVKLHKNLLEQYRKLQNAWFLALVELADDAWRKTKQLGAISGIQRYAAEALGLEREWLMLIPEAVVKCPACKVSVDSEAIICHNCSAIIKEEDYKKFKFATKG